MSKRSYPRPKPLTPEELAWFEDVIRLGARNASVQLEMKLDTGMTEFGNGFDDELPMTVEVVHEPK